MKRVPLSVAARKALEAGIKSAKEKPTRYRGTFVPGTWKPVRETPAERRTRLEAVFVQVIETHSDLLRKLAASEALDQRAFDFGVQYDREDDDRWIAEIPTMPGVVAYGSSRQEAMERVLALAADTAHALAASEARDRGRRG